MLALPSSVTLTTGQGGLPRVIVDGPAGAAEIYLQGAHVTSWRPAGRDEVLWMSASSAYAPGEPLRGGIPVCFPWFGAHPEVPAAPAHGFARRMPWTLLGASEDGTTVTVSLGLTDSERTRQSAWPHRFAATLTVTVGARLTVALTVINHDTVPVTVEEALHTYLDVEDVAAVRVTGLEGAPYLDRLAGPDPVVEAGPVLVTGETDRVYPGTQATVVVEDPSRGRALTVEKSGSDTTVVWNPWIDKAAAMPDFGDAEWPGMICVETANVRTDAVRIGPGESRTMTATLSVAPLV